MNVKWTKFFHSQRLVDNADSTDDDVIEDRNKVPYVGISRDTNQNTFLNNFVAAVIRRAKSDYIVIMDNLTVGKLGDIKKVW